MLRIVTEKNKDDGLNYIKKFTVVMKKQMVANNDPSVSYINTDKIPKGFYLNCGNYILDHNSSIKLGPKSFIKDN